MTIQNTGSTTDKIKPFDSKHWARLSQIQRFLANIGDRNIGARAAMLGYDSEEHGYAWNQYSIAMGMDRSFDHYLAESEAEHLLGSDEATLNRYRWLDKWENKWLPRTRAALRRFIPAEKREVFVDAFFNDLRQQPEGPAVVTSMQTFLSRFEALKDSDTSGARAAFDSLAKRGLNDELRAQIHATIQAAQDSATPTPAARISPDEIQKAWQRQYEAYDRINLWYIDWAETLRQELSYHQSVRLGLIKSRSGRVVADDTVAEDTIAEPLDDSIETAID